VTVNLRSTAPAACRARQPGPHRGVDEDNARSRTSPTIRRWRSSGMLPLALAGGAVQHSARRLGQHQPDLCREMRTSDEA
jgi:hypothetical protein